jgi:hypothetical protein
MALGHEKLDVYRLAISYVAWVFEHSEQLNGVHRHAREHKIELDRMAAMLSRLGKRGYSVQEESAGYGVDFDSDFDFDPDKTNSQQDAAANSASLRRRA